MDEPDARFSSVIRTSKIGRYGRQNWTLREAAGICMASLPQYPLLNHNITFLRRTTILWESHCQNRTPAPSLCFRASFRGKPLSPAPASAHPAPPQPENWVDPYDSKLAFTRAFKCCLIKCNMLQISKNVGRHDVDLICSMRCWISSQISSEGWTWNGESNDRWQIWSLYLLRYGAMNESEFKFVFSRPTHYTRFDLGGSYSNLYQSWVAPAPEVLCNSEMKIGRQR